MVPYLDLKAQYREIKPELDVAIAQVLEGANFVLGPEVATFEERFATYCGTQHCVSVNSGTSALHLALLAAGIGAGDEVITVSMTFVATVAAILYTGATPVFVDVDPCTWTMDPALIERRITPNTRAILPVHLHGRMADMDAIMAIARTHSLTVIEDAAQAHGAEYKGRRAGSIGDFGCFSFYPGKNLGAYGEGGAVVTNDRESTSALALLRNWGQASKYDHVLAGYNYRMDAVQCAILNVKMNHIERWTDARINVAEQYDRLLADLPCRRPATDGSGRHVFHVYAIATEHRDRLQAALSAAGIGTGIHYPVPVHLQKAYAGLGRGHDDLPITEKLASELLSLPIYPELATADVSFVATQIQALLEPELQSA